MKNVIRRGNIYYFNISIPKDLREHYNGKTEIRRTLETSDINIAASKADLIRSQIKSEWQVLRNLFATQKSDDFIKILDRMGFVPKQANQMNKDEIKARINLLHEYKPEEKQARAALGEKIDLFPLSELVDKVISIQADLKSKTEAELHRYKVPRLRSVKLLISMIGNVDIKKLSRNHALTFYKYIQKRMNEGEIKLETANKNLRYLSGMLAIIADHYDKPELKIFKGLSFKKSAINKEKNASQKRLPLPSEWLKENIRDGKALDRLKNPAYRALVKIMTDTGARPKEICILTAKQIFLDAPIPYISIEATEKGGVKNKSAVRKIPLIGLALEALKEYPEGLPIKNTDSATAAINKNWREAGIFPIAPEGCIYSLYSIRHAKSDALRNAGEFQLAEAILGHDIVGGRGYDYGDGFTLEKMKDLLEKVSVVKI